MESEDSLKSLTPPNPQQDYLHLLSPSLKKDSLLDPQDSLILAPLRKLTLSSETPSKLTISKDSATIRKSYLAKLISHGLWSTDPAKRRALNSLIIFDWDDTLMCTTFLTPNGYFDDNMVISERNKEKLLNLEKSVNKLLTMSMVKGDVYIVTNAEKGWVEYSAGRFFPSVVPLLERIKIISARELYERLFPHNIAMWKIEAFKDIVGHFDKDRITNIICVGDSFNELNAGKKLAKKFKNVCIKSIKFKQNPKIDDLKIQLNLVIDKFEFIFSAVKNWTITVENQSRKKNSM